MEQTKEINPAIKITKIVLTVLYYLLLLALLTFSIMTIASSGEKRIPNLFGRGYLSVQTNSMNGDNEDSFDKGDLIYVRVLNDKRRDNLKVGDIVTFYDATIKSLNTHRIVEINETSTGKAVITQGDHPDSLRDPSRPIEDMLAVYTGQNKGGGKFIDFIQSKLGFGLLIVLPVFILFVVQGVRIYFLYKGNKEEKDAVDLEAEKEKLRAQILQELAEEKKKDEEGK